MAIFIIFLDDTMLLLLVNANVIHHVKKRGAFVQRSSW